MLLLLRRLQSNRLSGRAISSICRRSSSNSAQAQQHEPLKILFCGADDFSIFSLQALCDLQYTRPGIVDSIDVVCRPDKRVGRGLKKLKQVPVKKAAIELDLPIHQIDTFTGWSPPSGTNLVVAVSFGLLVPARILNGAKYGGLNVHPSMLPDLRGPAPIVQSLLKRRSHTGVTLQTMHPTRFDHGRIIAQSPKPGIEMKSSWAPDELVRVLGPLGANLLREGVESGAFVSPSPADAVAETEPKCVEHAPKIIPEDRRIDWGSWTADDIVLRDRVLGRLWDREIYSMCLPGHPSKRITFEGPWTIDDKRSDASRIGRLGPAGQATLVYYQDGDDHTVGITTADERVAIPFSATIEGEGKGKGLPVLARALYDVME